MRISRLITLLGVVLTPGLSGCFNIAPSALVDDDIKSAKLRVFDGPTIYLNPGETCIGSFEKMHRLTAGGLASLTIDRKLGMPETDDLPVSYHEYVIPAGEPSTLYLPENNNRCDIPPRYFTPQPGKYYDASLKTDFWSGACRLRVREILQNRNGKVTTRHVGTLPAHRCQE